MRWSQFLVTSIVLLTIFAVSASNGGVRAQDGAEATIASLETRVAELEGTVAARGDKINAQRTQIAELKGEEPTPIPERSERCEDVHENATAWLIDGLNQDIGITLRGVQAVRSEDFEKVWFVAADIEGPGFEGGDQIAVWVMNEIDEAVGVSEGALTMSVNDIALEVNGYWFHGPDTDAQTKMSDDGAEEAMECTRSAIGG